MIGVTHIFTIYLMKDMIFHKNLANLTLEKRKETIITIVKLKK